jgi:nucleoside-diphosphate-sugar epimerase
LYSRGGGNNRRQNQHSKKTPKHNIDRLKATGFVSTVSLEDGIRETYEWYQQNSNHTGRYDAFNGEDKTLKTNK